MLGKLILFASCGLIFSQVMSGKPGAWIGYLTNRLQLVPLKG